MSSVPSESMSLIVVPAWLRGNRHGAFCFGHAAHAFRTWGVLKSSWGVLVLVMGRFAAVPGGAASPLPAIRRRTGNEDVDPPLWPDSCANCKFQETIIALVGIGIRNSAPSLHTTKSLKNRHPSAKVFIAANRVCPHKIQVRQFDEVFFNAITK